MTALLQVTDLAKHYRARTRLGASSDALVHAVDGVSFTVHDGETLALVGESGCGKSTTARVILRLTSPTSGHVCLEGRDVHALQGDDLRWFRLNVQAVFQDPWGSLSPRRRVRDIVAEPLQVNRKVSRREARAAVIELLEQIGLRASDADLYPHEFSGGQRQRIALASALITHPRLILLDEPVSALDVSVQAQVLNLLRSIQEERGTAFLLIAHNLATVRYVAHSVAVMYLGEIVEAGPVEAVYEHRAHPYTQALFDSTLPFHPDDRRDVVVKGEPPDPTNPPTGCRFRTRCPFAMDVCEQVPAAVELAPGHVVRCHLYDADAA